MSSKLSKLSQKGFPCTKDFLKHTMIFKSLFSINDKIFQNCKNETNEGG